MGGSNAKSMIIVAASTVLGVGLLTLIFYQTFWIPFSNLNKDLEQATDDLDAKQKEFKRFAARKKHLEDVRRASFPLPSKDKVDTWSVEYGNYLQNLVKGLKDRQVNPPPPMAEPKTAVNKKAQVGQVIRTWNVRGKGKWSTIVAILREFERTPRLHRIKAVHVERPLAESSDKKEKDKKGYVDELTVSLTIETLSMVRGENKPMMPDLAERSYDELERWNMFRGGPPPRKGSVGSGGEPVEPPVTDDKLNPFEKGDVRKFVRLIKIQKSIEPITIVVRPAGTPVPQPRLQKGLEYPALSFDPDQPIEVALDKSKAVEVSVNLMTLKGDHRGDRIECVTPPRGVKAVIRPDGNLRLTIDRKAVPGTYEVRVGSESAELRNLLVDDERKSLDSAIPPVAFFAKGSKFAKSAYGAVANRSGFETFLIASEDPPGLEQASGQLLYIDYQEIYILTRDNKVKGSEKAVYRLHKGESLLDCITRGPLKSSEFQNLDWWALSRVGVSTAGLLGSPGPGAFLAGFSLFPDRPGLRNIMRLAEPLENGSKVSRIGGD